ncbi:MAG: B12-binding domain-containing protein [Acidobacteria bacterium]|nr:B12-binding domain-containing protein [Acidobacteriota bacterium]
MNEIGQRFEAGGLFVPQMLIAARAMQAGLKYLKPYLAKAEVKAAGKAAIGTVKGDLHDIGKNLVAMMLEGAGFEMQDLGVDVAAGAFEGLCGRVPISSGCPPCSPPPCQIWKPPSRPSRLWACVTR